MFNYLKKSYMYENSLFHLIVNNAFFVMNQKYVLVTDLWLQTGMCLKGMKTRPCLPNILKPKPLQQQKLHNNKMFVFKKNKQPIK